MASLQLMNKIADFAFAEVPFIFTKHEVLSKDNAEVPFIFTKHEVLSKDNTEVPSKVKSNFVNNLANVIVVLYDILHYFCV